MARASQERGDHTRAVATLDAALALVARDSEIARQRASALAMLPDAYFYGDDLDRAERAALDAERILAKQPDPQLLVDVRADLAQLRQREGSDP